MSDLPARIAEEINLQTWAAKTVLAQRKPSSYAQALARQVLRAAEVDRRELTQGVFLGDLAERYGVTE